jgi:enoyl-CoA hydratase
MILTGRPVDAREALSMGLANRVVPRGRAREQAEELALTIAGFPQVCMQNDRRSVYDSLGEPLDVAMKNELSLGMQTLESGESLHGAQRFAHGAGRHGKVE